MGWLRLLPYLQATLQVRPQTWWPTVLLLAQPQPLAQTRLQG